MNEVDLGGVLETYDCLLSGYKNMPGMKLEDAFSSSAIESIEKEQAWLESIKTRLLWQPMSTVPKDGREVLLKVERRAGIPHRCLVGHYMPGGHCIEDHPPIDEGWYFWNGCAFDEASKPVAWMALPKEEE